MRDATTSVLFGAHAFFLHPFLVFGAYWRLYGFPRDPRLWLAFALHDIGYVGRESVEGFGSEEHVELGGQVMDLIAGTRWGSFVRRHSRYWCHLHGQPYSRLCVADKLAFVMTPAWLYLSMTRVTGELGEYMAVADGRQAGGKFTDPERRLLQSGDERLWLEGLKSYTARWVEQHRDERRDTLTAPASSVKQLIVRAVAR
jgi:hypothetical protein